MKKRSYIFLSYIFLFGQRQIQIAKSPRQSGMQARRQPSRMSRNNQPKTVVLVRIGLGVFVRVDQAAMI
jgi:hypothetical protein